MITKRDLERQPAMRDVLAATLALHEGDARGLAEIVQNTPDKNKFLLHCLALLAQVGIANAGGERAWIEQQRQMLALSQLMGVTD